MIDPSVEELVALTKAPRIVNRAKPPHIATVWRWANHGVRGQRLESMFVGGVRYTSTEAVGRFLTALNSDSPGSVPDAPNRAAELAGQKLAAMGC